MRPARPLSRRSRLRRARVRPCDRPSPLVQQPRSRESALHARPDQQRTVGAYTLPHRIHHEQTRVRAMASRGRLSAGASVSNKPMTHSAKCAAHAATSQRSGSLSDCGEAMPAAFHAAGTSMPQAAGSPEQVVPRHPRVQGGATTVRSGSSPAVSARRFGQPT